MSQTPPLELDEWGSLQNIETNKRPMNALDVYELLPENMGLHSLRELERAALSRTLRVTNGNKTQTAKALGIDRRTLYRKLGKFKLL